jgi:hypothetical protein
LTLETLCFFFGLFLLQLLRVLALLSILQISSFVSSIMTKVMPLMGSLHSAIFCSSLFWHLSKIQTISSVRKDKATEDIIKTQISLLTVSLLVSLELACTRLLLNIACIHYTVN